MKLSFLLSLLPSAQIHGSADVEICGIAYDSRKVEPGFLFIAIPGFKEEGLQFVGDALKKGATGVVSEKRPSQEGIPWIQVPEARLALSHLSSVFYGHPSRDLCLVGITGTNGKTTTSFLLDSIFLMAGKKTGLLGTVEYRVGGKSVPATVTTPQSLDLQQMFRQMVHDKVSHVTMEVSSHSMALHRVSHCQFNAAIFTNLTQDHLDFHRTMEEYFSCKQKLFTEVLEKSSKEDRFAILNADDPWSKKITLGKGVKVVNYGIENKKAQVRGVRVECRLDGVRFEIDSPQGKLSISSRLLGRHNVYNILAAVTTAQALGLDSEAISRGVASLQAVPGRLEPIPNDSGITVVVDYAHTPDALEKVLRTLKETRPARLITIFGCGGDRDRGKRPLMAKAAASYSDTTIVTSDNPRSEDPKKIIEEVLVGFENGSDYTVVVDRGEAIRRGIETARSGDTVLIAGKGHETYQIIGEERHHFDDREEARIALNKRQCSH